MIAAYFYICVLRHPWAAVQARRRHYANLLLSSQSRPINLLILQNEAIRRSSRTFGCCDRAVPHGPGKSRMSPLPPSETAAHLSPVPT